MRRKNCPDCPRCPDVGFSPFTVTSASIGFVGLVTLCLLKMKAKSKSEVKKATKGLKRSARLKDRYDPKFIIGGNWKCAADFEKTADLVEMLNDASIPTDIEIFVAPSLPFMASVSENLRGDVAVCAQNCSGTPMGAFTGETAPIMLSNVGCEWVIVGHSERRHQESSDLNARKAKAAVDNGLAVVFCIGETKAQRDSDGEKLREVLFDDQLSALVKEIGTDTGVWDSIVLAYEPLWAIGTGIAATPEDVQSTHAMIRNWIGENVGIVVSSSLRIQYGGSVKGGNAAELAKCPDVNGFLVGGAALQQDFVTLINNAAAIVQSK